LRAASFRSGDSDEDASDSSDDSEDEAERSRSRRESEESVHEIHQEAEIDEQLKEKKRLFSLVQKSQRAAIQQKHNEIATAKPADSQTAVKHRESVKTVQKVQRQSLLAQQPEQMTKGASLLFGSFVESDIKDVKAPEKKKDQPGKEISPESQGVDKDQKSEGKEKSSEQKKKSVGFGDPSDMKTSDSKIDDQNKKPKKKAVGFGVSIEEDKASPDSFPKSSVSNQKPRSALKGSRASDSTIINKAGYEPKRKRGISFDPSFLSELDQKDPLTSSVIPPTRVGFDLLADDDGNNKTVQSKEQETEKKEEINESISGQVNNKETVAEASSPPTTITIESAKYVRRTDSENNGLRSSFMQESMTEEEKEAKKKLKVSWSPDVEDKLSKAEKFDVENFMQNTTGLTSGASSSVSSDSTSVSLDSTDPSDSTTNGDTSLDRKGTPI
jgi:hypothetical protein